jgi:hypothetical protein
MSGDGGFCAADNCGQWDIIGNGEPMQSNDDIAKAEHRGSAGCLIIATSNEASGEPGGGAQDGAEVARPDHCLQVQNDSSIFLHWRSID